MRCCTLVLLIASIVTPAHAQDAATPAPERLIISEHAIAKSLAEDPLVSSVQSSRDSLKNGTIIGAVIGAAAMGGFVTWLCYQLREPGDPPCWKATVYAGALGAGAGALGGLAVDAMISRTHQRRLSPVVRPSRGEPHRRDIPD